MKIKMINKNKDINNMINNRFVIRLIIIMWIRIGIEEERWLRDQRDRDRYRSYIYKD
jgi:hypothetical protein